MSPPRSRLLFLRKLACFMSLAVFPSIAVAEGVSRAVVIVPGDYQEFAPVPFLNKGMLELSQHLKLAGFDDEHVVILNTSQDEHTLTNESIVEALDEFVNMSNSEDLLLVAIAGHGMQLNGKDYICLGATTKQDVHQLMEASSSSSNLTQNLVRLQEIVSTMSLSAAGQKLLIVDTAGSRSPLKDGGNFPRGLSANEKFGTQVLGISGGTWTICSRSGRLTETKQAEKSKTRFMRSVLEGLALHADANNNKSVSLLEISDYIQRFAEAENSIPPVFQGKLNVDFELVKTTRESTADALPSTIRTLLYSQMRDLAIKALVIEQDADVAINALERAALYAHEPQLKSELEGLHLTAMATSGEVQKAWQLANSLDRSLLMIVANPSKVFKERSGKTETQYVQLRRRIKPRQIYSDPVVGDLSSGTMIRVVNIDKSRIQFDLAFQQVESNTHIDFKNSEKPPGWIDLTAFSSSQSANFNSVTSTR